MGKYMHLIIEVALKNISVISILGSEETIDLLVKLYRSAGVGSLKCHSIPRSEETRPARAAL